MRRDSDSTQLPCHNRPCSGRPATAVQQHATAPPLPLYFVQPHQPPFTQPSDKRLSALPFPPGSPSCLLSVALHTALLKGASRIPSQKNKIKSLTQCSPGPA